jgi:hypothetical protein
LRDRGDPGAVGNVEVFPGNKSGCLAQRGQQTEGGGAIEDAKKDAGAQAKAIRLDIGTKAL